VQGVASLQGSATRNNDDLSRQVVSLAAAENASAFTTPLLNAQEAEESNSSLPNFPAGGWGAASGFATDSLDTALALRALRAAGFEAGLTVVNEQVAVGVTTSAHPFNFPGGASGLSVLVRATTGKIRLFAGTPTSGTFSLDRDPSNVPINLVGLPEETGTYTLQVQNLDTGPVFYSLEARFTTADGFSVERNSRALRYLGLAQNADGGWGIARGEDSSLMITAEVLRTLEAYGGTFAPRSAIDNGANWIITTKRNPDNGFGSMPGTSTVYETALAILAIHGANPTAPSLDPARAYLGATQLANGSWNNDPYATALALRASVLITGCIMDVDGKNPCCDVSTDVVYVARHLLGLTPVPPAFRIIDPTIPPDASVGAAIDAIRPSLDVDMNGSVDVATDVVYIARHLLGLTPVPPSFRVVDPTIPPDAAIAGKIDALCPGP
jgi:hypothetical protein